MGMGHEAVNYPAVRRTGLPNSSGIANKNFVALVGLTFPPRAGVLVPKTQIFLLQHVPISLVFAYGIDGQDNF
jgi:hypothetical protein